MQLNALTYISASTDNSTLSWVTYAIKRPLDDIPISLAGATPDIRVFDLERVEFIRGPQGTLYGAGAMAGTIRYITQKPDTRNFSGALVGTGATTDGGSGSYSARGMLNVPLIDSTLALRVTAYQGRDGGYLENIRLDRRNTNYQDNTQVRAAIRFADGGPLTLDASYYYGEVKTGANDTTYAGLDSLQYSSNTPETYRDRNGIANLTVDYAFPVFDLISSSSYVDRTIHNDSNFEYGAAFFLGLPSNTVSNVLIDNKIKDFTEELRLSSRSAGVLKWQVGTFFERQERHFREDIPTAGLDSAFGINSLDYGAFTLDDQFSETQAPTTRQLAFFGEVTYAPIPALEFTAGLREFHWKQSFSLYSGGIAGALGPGQPLTASSDSTESGTNPRANVAYHLSPDVMIFAEAARGFRYGGINQPIPASFCGAALAAQGITNAPLTYGPDHLWTYSLGEKATFDDQRVTLNATGFLTNWSDAQTRHDLTCGYYYEENKGSVRSAGLELDARFQVTTGLSLGFNGSFTNAVANGPIENLNAPDGARVPYFPRTIATFDASYVTPTPLGRLILGADYNYRSAQGTEFDSTSPLYRQIPVTRVANATATLQSGAVEWTLFARNLANERIVTAIEPNVYGAIQPGDARYLGRPRTFGVKIGYRF